MARTRQSMENIQKEAFAGSGMCYGWTCNACHRLTASIIPGDSSVQEMTRLTKKTGKTQANENDGTCLERSKNSNLTRIMSECGACRLIQGHFAAVLSPTLAFAK